MTSLDYLASVIAGLKRQAAQMPTLRWGQVTGASPLRVTLDGDTQALAESPVDLCGRLAAGDRVLTVTAARRVYVLGRPGGARPADPNTLMIDGVAYPASGVIQVRGLPAWGLSSSPWWATSFEIDPPFAPPPGWFFALSTATTTGFTLVHGVTTGLTAGGKILARAVQFGSADRAALKSVTWRLTKS
ncbi:hypothetical protein I6B53_03230 [Schaalia sp. 19OD2882]|uniref:hypothetical protein n=1 Tax=Schaalia sp. 19OD2882 TaxID=2794089 RepID=UPI001C1F193F|nr:hypothetical protein [Schaalia sp. 19OD2882]QWW20123.1 hypothetical protein I6B53_03230 [Schaalia sp. 19OD2882]